MSTMKGTVNFTCAFVFMHLRCRHSQSDYLFPTTMKLPNEETSVDVNMEALHMLEDRMFDTSEDAGITGNCQWGLDVGMHQDNWCPWKFGGENGKVLTSLDIKKPGPDFDEDEQQEWF
ncbi:hypothetical protein EDD18DRAFT_1114662 [Armillaria luteobubalina]|uniref:Uncharacterized protein n=1 Tax=Armillaria luteobubalina TaxID=153913 RepID=A0AA39P558_9AGAR|nr:hypothetical protein EDD18DRAFT_1114662 [Armillaria luteobubalina]